MLGLKRETKAIHVLILPTGSGKHIMAALCKDAVKMAGNAHFDANPPERIDRTER